MSASMKAAAVVGRHERGSASVRQTRMTIAVTGGAGFVGSHLCERLLAAGHRVVCLDNLRTGERRRVERLADHPDYSFHLHDVRRPLPPALGRFDQIYNLACPASPPQYQIDPVDTALTCVLGMHNVLERAVRDGASVLQASTSEIYGDPLVHPQREDYCGNVNPVGPRACYDEGKRLAETLATEYHRHGVDVKIARIFNTYGPGMSADDGRVMSNFITQALAGADLTLYGDGRQTRSFCFVDDLVDGLTALMDHVGPLDAPVNLGNPAEITVADLAALVLEMTGARAKTVFMPRPTDDPGRRRPDILRAQALLDWRPRTSLREGVARTIAYFAAEGRVCNASEAGARASGPEAVTPPSVALAL